MRAPWGLSGFLGFLAALFALVVLVGCSDSSAPTSPNGHVVLYTSADDHLAKLLADAFTAQSGIKVQLLGDTEATKTTGLVTRVLAELQDPKGDVWWSSEPVGTLLLAENNALLPGAMRGAVPDDWPEGLVGDDYSWIGFAQRARVIVYATDRVDSPPTTLRALIDAQWSKRIGIARPAFGTTRGHMVLLSHRWGGEGFQHWLDGLKDNRVRLYDGNMSVVRAIAMGEIDIGLTDTDDVFAGQGNGWAVDLVYESVSDHPTMPSMGPTTIPNTVGVIAGGPNPDNAKRLAAFLVSPETEWIIAQSPSGNFPVHRALAGEFSDAMEGISGVFIDYAEGYRSSDDAMDRCERTLEGP